MKARIERSDGTVIEFEGTAEEVDKAVAKLAPMTPKTEFFPFVCDDSDDIVWVPHEYPEPRRGNISNHGNMCACPRCCRPGTIFKVG